MRVLFLTRYTATGPSSRYRVVQFLPYLERAGIASRVHPLVDDRYLAARFAGKSPGGWYLARRALGRVRTLLDAADYDVVFVQKDLFPSAPPLAEYLLARVHRRVILDIDDAIHLPYHGHPLWGDKVERAMRYATLVLAGNRWLAEEARTHNPNTLLFPTVVDAERFTPHRQPPHHAKLVVGWIGSPETARYLAGMRDVLARLQARVPFELRLIGSDRGIPGVDTTTRTWSLETEADELRQLDVGIMPLADDAWTRGKCSLKLLQYMSTGLATVSSPCGSVMEIVRDGDNGFVAHEDAAWETRLEKLLTDAALRERMGARARAWLVQHYALQNYGPRFVDILCGVARGQVMRDE